MKNLGRWKNKKGGRTRFARKSLALTDATQTEIAERAGLKRQSVQKLQGREHIRSLGEGRAIADKATRLKMTGRTLPPKREKIAFFKPAEKAVIVERNLDCIESVARSWWKSPQIKNSFPDYKSLLEEVKRFVFSELDYFDPNTGKTGNLEARIKRWVWRGARIFCRRKYFEEKRAEDNSEKLKKAAKSASAETGRSYVPVPSRYFLRRIGVGIEAVAELGYSEVREELKRISALPETGLTADEKKVTDMLLDGNKLMQIAPAIGIRSKSAVHKNEVRAAEKIRKAIARIAVTRRANH